MIEIDGFPQNTEENTEQLPIVIDLADEMGISIRLSKREKAGRPVIITFKSRELRNKFNEPMKQIVGFKFIIYVVCIACVSVKITEQL